MKIAFLNPQGNFDPQDRYWTAHPDFGGQLVYVKEVAMALGRMGHQIECLQQIHQLQQHRLQHHQLRPIMTIHTSLSIHHLPRLLLRGHQHKVLRLV